MSFSSRLNGLRHTHGILHYLTFPYMTLFRKRLFMTVFCINPDFPDDRPIPARLLRARSERPRHRHTAAEKRAPTFLCWRFFRRSL